MNLERRARLRERLQRHELHLPFSASWNTAWRWLKVPRSTSSPVRRIGSAVGEDRGERQFLGRRPVDRPLGRIVRAARRRSRPRSSFLWNVKPAGALQAVVDLAQRGNGTPVSVLPAMPAGAGSETGGTKSSSGFSEANACSSSVKCFFTSAVRFARVCPV